MLIFKHSTSFQSFITLPFVLFIIVPLQAQYSGGTGEPNDPYQIVTAEQMNAIGTESNDWDKNFILTADIDLAQYTGTQFNIIKSFTGTFDGNGHTLLNFTYTSTNKNYVGIFGSIENGIIKI